MNDFKSAYQAAIQDISVSGMKDLHIDVSDCMDRVRHQRYIVRRARRATAAAFSVMCVIFICGFGTVKAAEYIQNVIRVSAWGFESGDAATMASADRAYLLGEEVGPVSAAKETPAAPASKEAAAPASESAAGEAGTSAAGDATAGASAAAVNESGLAVAAESTEGIMADEALGTASSVSRELKEMAVAGAEPRDAEGTGADAAFETTEIEDIPVYTYNSFEEFEKNETILFPQPSISIGTNITSTDITVCGDWAMVRYDVDGKVLWLERTDYADTDGHTSSKVFPGGVENERTYTTPQGYTYTLVDSVKESRGEELQIHAAATVGSYEVFIDFMGFGEKEAEKIMDSIDLSLYE